MYIRIDCFYSPKKSKKEYEIATDLLPVKEALQLAEDMEQSGRIVKIQFVDDTGQTWIKKQLLKYLESLKGEPHTITAFFDGGFQKDTSAAGAGIVIYYEQNEKQFRLRKNQPFELITSNNEAEYAALWMLVNELEVLGVHHIPITIKGDSLVVINQITDEWPCYEEEHLRWIEKIEEKIKKNGLTPTFELIDRKGNQEADQLATQALNEVVIESTIEIEK